MTVHLQADQECNHHHIRLKEDCWPLSVERVDSRYTMTFVTIW